MGTFMLIVAIAVLGFIVYQANSMKARKPKVSGKGRTIVVDHTKPDTSKEDSIDERFGDSLKDNDLK